MTVLMTMVGGRAVFPDGDFAKVPTQEKLGIQSPPNQPVRKRLPTALSIHMV